MYCGHPRLCVCPRPHAYTCTDPDVTWGVVGDSPSCALLCEFAIGARVALLWQHNANPGYKLASISQYDNINQQRSIIGVFEQPTNRNRWEQYTI